MAKAIVKMGQNTETGEYSFFKIVDGIVVAFSAGLSLDDVRKIRRNEMKVRFTWLKRDIDPEFCGWIDKLYSECYHLPL